MGRMQVRCFVCQSICPSPVKRDCCGYGEDSIGKKSRSAPKAKTYTAYSTSLHLLLLLKPVKCGLHVRGHAFGIHCLKMRYNDGEINSVPDFESRFSCTVKQFRSNDNIPLFRKTVSYAPDM